MKDLKDTFSNKAVYLKLIVLILCFLALLIWTCHDAKWGDLRVYGTTKLVTAIVFNYGGHFEMMVVATGGYMIVMLLFVIIIIADENNRTFEILFLIGGIVLNLGSGIWLIIDAIAYDGSLIVLLIAALTLAAGIVLIIDLIRAFKSGSKSGE